MVSGVEVVSGVSHAVMCLMVSGVSHAVVCLMVSSVPDGQWCV